MRDSFGDNDAKTASAKYPVCRALTALLRNFGIASVAKVNRGDMILQLSRASNPQKDENTQIIRNRGYRVEEQRISLDSDTPMFMAIGYGFAPGENSRLSFGINYRPQSTSALSIDWHWDF